MLPSVTLDPRKLDVSGFYYVCTVHCAVAIVVTTSKAKAVTRACHFDSLKKQFVRVIYLGPTLEGADKRDHCFD